MPFAEQEKKPLVNVTLRTNAISPPQAFQIKGRLCSTSKKTLP